MIGPRSIAMFERMRRTPGATETIRYRFHRADGELRWIEMVATNHSDDPAVLGFVTNARDITERVEAENTIRASEERLSGLVANISDTISVIDAHGVLQYTSPTSERIYGYKEGEWPDGQSIFDIVHPDDRDRVIELWTGAVRTSGPFRPFQIRLQKQDGTWMYAEIVANNLLDDPAVNGIVVTSRDVTERKHAEEALRERSERVCARARRATGVSSTTRPSSFAATTPR